jgi:hypothetical protein
MLARNALESGRPLCCEPSRLILINATEINPIDNVTVRPDHTGAVFFHRSFSRISPNLLRKKNGMKGPAQPSPMIGQCLSGGLGWLEVECNRCRTRASLLLDPSAGRGDKPR